MLCLSFSYSFSVGNGGDVEAEAETPKKSVEMVKGKGPTMNDMIASSIKKVEQLSEARALKEKTDKLQKLREQQLSAEARAFSEGEN